ALTKWLEPLTIICRLLKCLLFRVLPSQAHRKCGFFAFLSVQIGACGTSLPIKNKPAPKTSLTGVSRAGTKTTLCCADMPHGIGEEAKLDSLNTLVLGTKIIGLLAVMQSHCFIGQ
ncbi:MAG: hypothetical protein IJM41_09100, partial [Bacteroidales bacterium]|nr:hypothetical protein [Bacteroidales bacterium]